MLCVLKHHCNHTKQQQQHKIARVIFVILVNQPEPKVNQNVKQKGRNEVTKLRLLRVVVEAFLATSGS